MIRSNPASLDRASLRPTSAALASIVPSAATVGSGDDRSDREDNDAADRAKERQCAIPKRRHSAPRAYLATADPPIVPTFRTKQRFEHRPLGVAEVHALIYVIRHKLQPLSAMKVFMR